eukprot:1159464-Pelagomonas_calceolata.AAC.10
MAKNLLWPLSTFLHTSDIIDVIPDVIHVMSRNASYLPSGTNQAGVKFFVEPVGQRNAVSSILYSTLGKAPPSLVYFFLAFQTMQGNKFDQVWDNSGIAALPEIRGVFLEENGLRGALPDDMFISFLPRLEQLGLRNNKHSGTLPAMSLFSLKFVDLTGNRFAGPVPDSWAIMARPGLEVALHTNYLSCCGTGPLSVRNGGDISIFVSPQNIIGG